MAAAVPELRAVGLKLLSIFPENAWHGRAVLNAVVVLVDPETGRCDAVIDGGALTAYRTAAASGVASKHLAREDSRVLGLIGAGIERGPTSTQSAQCGRSNASWSGAVRAQTAERFARDVADRGLPIEVVEKAEKVVAPADVLCTLTPSRDPIVCGVVRPGLHVNAVGTHWITHREIDTEAVTRSRVVVDSRDANEAECGDLMIPVSEGCDGLGHFEVELGQVVNGDRPGRQTKDEITMYQSVGVAIQRRRHGEAARRSGEGKWCRD